MFVYNDIFSSHNRITKKVNDYMSDKLPISIRLPDVFLQKKLEMTMLLPLPYHVKKCLTFARFRGKPCRTGC